MGRTGHMRDLDQGGNTGDSCRIKVALLLFDCSSLLFILLFLLFLLQPLQGSLTMPTLSLQFTQKIRPLPYVTLNNTRLDTILKVSPNPLAIIRHQERIQRRTYKIGRRFQVHCQPTLRGPSPVISRLRDIEAQLRSVGRSRGSGVYSNFASS